MNTCLHLRAHLALNRPLFIAAKNVPCKSFIAATTTGWLRSLTLYVAAVGTVWPLLGSPRYVWPDSIVPLSKTLTL